MSDKSEREHCEAVARTIGLHFGIQRGRHEDIADLIQRERADAAAKARADERNNALREAASKCDELANLFSDGRRASARLCAESIRALAKEAKR